MRKLSLMMMFAIVAVALIQHYGMRQAFALETCSGLRVGTQSKCSVAPDISKNRIERADCPPTMTAENCKSVIAYHIDIFTCLENQYQVGLCPISAPLGAICYTKMCKASTDSANETGCYITRNCEMGFFPVPGSPMYPVCMQTATSTGTKQRMIMSEDCTIQVVIPAP
jgi:hypothetical protein